MIKLSKKIMGKKLFLSLLAVFLLGCCFLVNNVSAYNDFFSNNDVLFYDPSEAEAEADCVETEAGAGPGGLLSVGSGSRVHLNGPAKTNRDIVAKALAAHNFKGNGGKPLNAVQLAAILGNLEIEAHFDPDAGFLSGVPKDPVVGIAQWATAYTRYTDIAEPRNSLDNQIAAIINELDGDEYRNGVQDFWEITSSNDIDKATFLIARNYEKCWIIGDKGPVYWENYETSVRQIQAYDGRAQSAREIYNMYGSLATGEGRVYDDECNPMGLKSGGMNMTQATAFMAEYRSLQPADWKTAWAGKTVVTPYNVHVTGCVGGSLANCSAFTHYFINRYTTRANLGAKDGKDYVGHLIKYGFTDGGSAPRIYSVFSRQSGGDGHGHTGIVLGIDEENDTMIVGEAGCGQLLSYAGAHSKKLSEWKSSTNYSYAYTDDFLKMDEL